MLPLRWKKLSRILHIDEASCLDISWIAFPKLTLYEINWSCARYLCSKLLFLMHSEAALAVACWCFSERTLIENLWLLGITLRVRSLDCAVSCYETQHCLMWQLRENGRHKYCMCFNTDMYDVHLFPVINIQSFIDNKQEKVHLLHFTENITGHCMSHC